MNLLLFIAGLAALVGGAEALVRGASRLALVLGISPLVVGLTIVAFGTSAPELAVAVGAALEGRTDMAMGNVVGSNIFNVLFILGISALIVPLTVHRQVIRQEVPIMVGASVLLVVFALDGHIGFSDSALLLVLLVAYTVFLIVQSRRQVSETEDEYASGASSSQWDRHWGVQLLLMAVGLTLLVFGSQWLVTSATVFARGLGVSELVIGLTIVAAGTSMPEVATSVIAAVRGQRDIAVGNVVGSSTFNILGCLGAAGLASGSGLPVAPSLLSFDLWVMVAVALACMPVFFTGREIARWEGGVFLTYYVAYAAYLILAARDHDALPQFSAVMLSFVVPLTVVTLVASTMRDR